MISSKGGTPLIKYSFDKIIHERTRLMILVYLADSSKQKVSFNELKTKLDLTAGNLSVQLSNLEQAGYIIIQKSFQNKKPVTDISLSPDGLTALKNYIVEMENVIKVIKDVSDR